MRAVRVARVAQLADLLTAPHALPLMDGDGTPQEMRLKGEAPRAQIEDDAVPGDVLQRDRVVVALDLVRDTIDPVSHTAPLRRWA